MLVALVFLTILSQVFQHAASSSSPVPLSPTYSCLPNSQFYLNGISCECDSSGRWSPQDCRGVGRPCRPGHVTWQGCTYCICQEDGETICTYTTCSEVSESSQVPFNASTRRKNKRSTAHLEAIGNTCTPLRSYYVNCNLCVCPPNGHSTEAQCIPDPSCAYKGNLTYDMIASLRTRKTYCIPNAIYIFQCVHCPCADDGMIYTDQCNETCNNTVLARTNNIQRCAPGALFRHNLQICLCPDDGLARKSRCGKSFDNSKLQSLSEIQSNKTDIKCVPNTFTTKKCIYCDCTKGMINHKSCIEGGCLHLPETHTGQKSKCKSGEVVPLCVECYCLHNKTTSDRFCTTSCSIMNKVKVLQKVLEDNTTEESFTLKNRLTHVSANDTCKAGLIFFDKQECKICICPDTGKKNSTLCVPIGDEEGTKNETNISINFNVSCEPFTMVDFDCNTCFCTKNGSIDPKWCTYDDCDQIKEVIRVNKALVPVSERNCTAGSISYAVCNFCICVKSNSGTKNICTSHSCEANTTTERITLDFACKPSSYYQVDCNICLCPVNGLKNVYMCTEDVCEKSFLRTDACLPGHLFSDNCNICVCSQSGNKRDMVCTDRACQDEVATWKSLLQRSGTLTTMRSASTRSLDLCFPGEEFEVGCSLCVCPEMGLRAFADCTESICDGQDKELPSEEFVGNYEEFRMNFDSFDVDETIEGSSRLATSLFRSGTTNSTIT